MRRWAAGIVACFLLGASATFVQKHEIHPRIDTGLNEDLLYLPNEKLITHFTAGLSGVLADLLWIQTINYASEEFNSKEKKFTWLEHMIRTVTRMDPYYEDAYANGGMLLSALGQADRSTELLQQGLIQLPHSQKIPRELVQNYLLNRRHEPGAPAVTLHYMNILAKNSEHPQQYIEWMDRIRENNSLEGEARRVWMDLLETSADQFVRDLARAQIAVLDAETTLDTLRNALDAFVNTRGAAPQSIEELLAFMGRGAPQLTEELGRFYIAPDGDVRNALLDGRTADRYQRVLARSITLYKKRHEKWPESLDALLEDYPNMAIEHPVPGYMWRYDPATGEITEAPALIGNG